MNERGEWKKVTGEIVDVFSRNKVSANQAFEILDEVKEVILEISPKSDYTHNPDYLQTIYNSLDSNENRIKRSAEDIIEACALHNRVNATIKEIILKIRGN